MTLENIEQQVASLADGFGGRAALVVQSLTAPASVAAFNPDLPFPSASLMKIPLVCTVAHMAAEGELVLTDGLTIAPDMPGLAQQRREGGSGILSRMQQEHLFTIEELAYLAIIISDNVAANILMKQLGRARVNHFLGDHGFSATRATHYFEDFKTLEDPAANPTTAAEMVRLLHLIQTEQIANAAWVRRLLANQQFRSRLPRFFTCRARVANKTASLDNCAHDAGIVYIGQQTYLVAVMVLTDRFRPALAFLEQCLRIVGHELCRPVADG